MCDSTTDPPDPTDGPAPRANRNGWRVVGNILLVPQQHALRGEAEVKEEVESESSISDSEGEDLVDSDDNMENDEELDDEDEDSGESDDDMDPDEELVDVDDDSEESGDDMEVYEENEEDQEEDETDSSEDEPIALPTPPPFLGRFPPLPQIAPDLVCPINPFRPIQVKREIKEEVVDGSYMDAEDIKPDPDAPVVYEDIKIYFIAHYRNGELIAGRRVD